MRTALVLGLGIIVAAPAAAFPGAHCDATLFTLGKPAPTQKAEVTPPKPTPAPLKVAKRPDPSPKGTQRLLANCKSKAAKKSG